MSSQQERRWTQDPEEFIQDEDEDFVGPRASGAAPQYCTCDTHDSCKSRDLCVYNSCLHVQAAYSWRHFLPLFRKQWLKPSYL